MKHRATNYHRPSRCAVRLIPQSLTRLTPSGLAPIPNRLRRLDLGCGHVRRVHDDERGSGEATAEMLQVGQTQQFVVTAFDSFESPFPDGFVPFVFKIIEGDGRISSGHFMATLPGTVTVRVTAWHDGVRYATATVTVVPAPEPIRPRGKQVKLEAMP